MSKKNRKPAVRSSTRKRPVPWRLLGIILGITFVMFGAGYVIAVRVLFPPLPEPENGIVVPALAGLTTREAEARLRALGLRVTEVLDVEHAGERPGIVIAQSPLAGQQLRELGAVRLGVSIDASRAAPVFMPDTSRYLLPAAPPDSLAPPPAEPDSVVPADTVSFFDS